MRGVSFAGDRKIAFIDVATLRQVRQKSCSRSKPPECADRI